MALKSISANRNEIRMYQPTFSGYESLRDYWFSSILTISRKKVLIFEKYEIKCQVILTAELTTVCDISIVIWKAKCPNFHTYTRNYSQYTLKIETASAQKIKVQSVGNWERHICQIFYQIQYSSPKSSKIVDWTLQAFGR